MARGRSAGWRSARWNAPSVAAGGGGAGVGALPAPAGSRARALPAPAEEAPAGALDERFLVSQWPWQGVQWSLAYICFLAYVFVITSYTIPVGTLTMVLALMGVFLGERIRFTAAGLLYAVFFAIGTIAFLGSSWKPFTQEIYTGIAKIMLVFFVAQIVLSSRERIRFFVFFYLGAIALYPVRGALFNYFLYHATEGGRVGWNNIFENPNDISALILFPFALAVGLISVERNKTLRLLAMGALICIPLVLALAQSRGALLAFIGGGAVFFIRNKRARKMMLVGTSVVALVFATLAPNQLWKRMSSLEQATSSGNLAAANDAGSAEQRWEIWKVSLLVIKSHPVFGVGPGSYPFEHVFASRDPTILQGAGGLRDAHSTYFTLAAEYGLFGFLVYMAAGAVVWHRSRSVRVLIQDKMPRHAQQLLLAEIGLIMFAAAAVFGTFIGLVFTYLQHAIVWGLADAAEQSAKDLGVIETSTLRRRA
jgi:O-antigen ligase